MKIYFSKPLAYLAMVAALTAYEIAGTETSYAGQRPNSYLIQRSGGSLIFGHNGNNRNITHDVQSRLRILQREKFELNNKLRNYNLPIQIKIRIRR